MADDKDKNHFDFGALRALSLITQAGLSFCVPLVLCILGASFLRDRFGLGQGVMLAGILLGLASGASGFANVLRTMERVSRPASSSARKTETERDFGAGKGEKEGEDFHAG